MPVEHGHRRVKRGAVYIFSTVVIMMYTDERSLVPFCRESIAERHCHYKMLTVLGRVNPHSRPYNVSRYIQLSATKTLGDDSYDNIVISSECLR